MVKEKTALRLEIGSLINTEDGALAFIDSINGAYGSYEEPETKERKVRELSEIKPVRMAPGIASAVGFSPFGDGFITLNNLQKEIGGRSLILDRSSIHNWSLKIAGIEEQFDFSYVHELQTLVRVFCREELEFPPLWM